MIKLHTVKNWGIAFDPQQNGKHINNLYSSTTQQTDRPTKIQPTNTTNTKLRPKA